MGIKEEAFEMINNPDTTAIAYSPGYGAGFSSWNENIKPHDPKLITAILEWGMIEDIQEDEIIVDIDKEFLTRAVEEAGQWTKDFYGGCEVIHIAFLPKGTVFRISEYDGYEGIEILDRSNFWTA